MTHSTLLGEKSRLVTIDKIILSIVDFVASHLKGKLTRLGLHIVQSYGGHSMSSLLDGPPPDAPEVQSSLAQCAFALGRLDGALRSLNPGIEPLLAAALLARSLIMALRDAGYAEAEGGWARWLPRGAPPQAEPHVALGTSALVEVVLRHAEQSSWPAVANSAAILRRAAPHLMTAAGAHTADLLLAADLLDQAKQITRLRPGFSIDSTLWHFANLVQAASASPNFALGRADLAIADTHQGRHTYYHAAARPHVWAFGLVTGDALRYAGLLSRSVPMGGSILLGAVRAELSQAERSAFLFAGLTQAAETILQLIDTCRERHTRSEHALSCFRSTAKAPAVFAFLAGAGPLTRAQIAAGFEVSRQGASGIIQALEATGLVLRKGGVIYPHSVEQERTGATPASPTLTHLTSLTEVDDALAALDALLARSAPLERGNGS